MFCHNCGKEIDDKAVVCVYCGVPVAGATAGGATGTVTAPAAPKGFPTAGLIGVILSVLTFFGEMAAYVMWPLVVKSGNGTSLLLIWAVLFLFSILCLIFGIVGVAQVKKKTMKGMGIAALIIGIAVFVMALITFMISVFVYMVVISATSSLVVGAI